MHKVRTARLLLRFGLVLVFGYAAVASLVSPNDWLGYLPPFATAIIPATVLLKLFSLYEIGLSLWLLSGAAARYAAILAAATMVGIVTTDIKLFAITFRDIAIASGAAALAVLSD